MCVCEIVCVRVCVCMQGLCGERKRGAMSTGGWQQARGSAAAGAAAAGAHLVRAREHVCWRVGGLPGQRPGVALARREAGLLLRHRVLGGLRGFPKGVEGTERLASAAAYGAAGGRGGTRARTAASQNMRAHTLTNAQRTVIARRPHLQPLERKARLLPDVPQRRRRPRNRRCAAHADVDLLVGRDLADDGAGHARLVEDAGRHVGVGG